MAFKPAVKRDAKGRVALIGPAGSGKSFTALILARLLAGPTGRIAAIDTEHGSLSKYAHTDTCGGSGVCLDPSHFEFDVEELDEFSPEGFVARLTEAETAGYEVFLTDSLSHFWMGKGGALEFVDNAAKRNRNGGNADGMSGWKDLRPHERKMVDRMIASPCHVICTMRTKNDYVDQVDGSGRKKRVKLGLAPVQRDGLEYEFDLVGLMDDENNLQIDKTRCSAYAGQVLTKPGPKEFAPFQEWLKGAKVVAAANGAPPTPQAAATSAGVKAEVLAVTPAIEVPEELKQVVAGLKEKGGAGVAFGILKKEMLEALPQSGGIEYVKILQKHGIKPSGPQQTAKMIEALVEMWKLAQWAKEVAAKATAAMQETPEPLPADEVVDITADPIPHGYDAGTPRLEADGKLSTEAA